MKQSFDSLQFVAFTSGRPKADAVDLWGRAFAGARPPNFSQIAGGGTQSGGTVGGASVMLQSQLGRIDVIVSPIPDLVPGGSMPDFEAAVEMGAEACLKAIKGEALLRPAVVFQTSEEAASLTEAVNRVAALAPVRFPTAAIDLSYQTIVPMKSVADPSVTINRLVRWNTAKKIMVRVDQAGGVINEGQMVAGRYVDVYAEGPVDPDRFERVFSEVVQEAKLLLSKGYERLA